MSDDEFDKYMFEECSQEPSDSEVIKNSGKTIENLIKEINSYHNELVFLAYKYELSLKNKIAFILKLCEKKEHIKELMPLLSCFIFKPDYIFNLKNKKVSIKKQGRLAEYLLLKEDIDIFEKRIDEIYANTRKYKNILRKIKKSGSRKNEDISLENKKVLIKLYKRYLQQKSKHKKTKDEYESRCIEENIEQIHNFAMSSAERQQIYPVIVFLILTRRKSSLTKEMGPIDGKNIMNYKKYMIDKDNGKNFNTYEKYISLFLELVENYESICDESLCMYVFEKTSNLAKWLYKNIDNNKIFYHTIDSLIESEYSSTFYEESIFWTDSNLNINDYTDFEIRDNDIKNDESQYLSELIKGKLTDEDVLDYLNEYAKGKIHGAKFIKKFAYNFLKSNDSKLENEEDEGYAFLIFEGEFQERADDIIKQKIIELLKDNS